MNMADVKSLYSTNSLKYFTLVFLSYQKFSAKMNILGDTTSTWPWRQKCTVPLYTLQLMWHSCKKSYIIVVGVIHSYNCGLWNKHDFQTFDVCV